jgi:dolichyl-diphosphooligosaccharide--protein glycosyltransferase
MTDVRRAAVDLLEERPTAEETLRTLLDRETATFDELPADSGLFGEIVSSQVVERTDDGSYEIADRDAVRAVLDGEPRVDGADRAVSAGPLTAVVDHARNVDRTLAAGLTGAIALVVLFRTWHVASVYRKGDVVLLGNDPYYYRYWVEHVVVSGNLGAGNLPSGVPTGEPLMVTSLSAMTTALGGTAEVAGHVLAWYPVVSAVIVAVLVYLLAVRLFEDPRIGLASVALLAVTPAHAYRSALGFADHHAFDYPWLVATVLALTVLADVSRDDLHSVHTVLWTVAFGVFVTGQALSWDSAAIVLIPLTAYAAIGTMYATQGGRSPAIVAAPLAIGLLIAALLTFASHSVMGWHTKQVASIPALVFLAVAGVSGMAEAGHRVGVSAKAMLSGEVILGLAGVAVVFQYLPGLGSQFFSRLHRLLSNEGVAETASIVGGKMGTIIGPILIFGFVFFLALPYLGWALWWAYHRKKPSWIPISVYGVYFIMLSMVQMRFGGELSPFLAVFAGIGFVHLASAVELIDRPAALGSDGPHPFTGEITVPDRRTIASLFVLFLLIASWGIIQVPVKTGQLTIDGESHDAAKWMQQDAERRNLAAHDRYVFSPWGRNRMYNYFVGGDPRAYSFAYRHYDKLVRADDPDDVWTRLQDRVQYVVVNQNDAASGSPALVQLHEHLGSTAGGNGGLSHYRARFVSSGGEVSVFSAVPGATIRMNGSTSPREISTNVTIQGASFEYVKSVYRDGDTVTATVAYPGEYTVGNRSVTVSEEAVRTGGIVDFS